MTLFFSVMLVVSIVGLVTLLVLKRYEMNTGWFFMGRLRPRVGHLFHRGLVFVERGVPGVMYSFFSRVVYTVRLHTQQVLARAIVLFETYLERTLHTVRQKSRAPQGEGAASQFLQEVAAHKQKLLRRGSKKRVILED